MNNCFNPITGECLYKQSCILQLGGGKYYYSMINSNFCLASKPTLSDLKKKIKARIEANQITTSSCMISTNQNSAKPSILQQLFRAFVVNNRLSNGRTEGIPKN